MRSVLCLALLLARASYAVVRPTMGYMVIDPSLVQPTCTLHDPFLATVAADGIITEPSTARASVSELIARYKVRQECVIVGQ